MSESIYRADDNSDTVYRTTDGRAFVVSGDKDCIAAELNTLAAERDAARADVERLREALEVSQGVATDHEFAANHVIAENTRLTAEVDRLWAVVEKLPRTADGVPVGIGSVVWDAVLTGARDGEVVGFFKDEDHVFVSRPGFDRPVALSLNYLYSTKAGADAARAAKGGQQ